MDIVNFKKYILENNYIQPILESIHCHHIRKRNGFYQCANPDGDNRTAICVYENEYLHTVDYTRNLSTQHRNADLIDLVSFFHKTEFPESIRFICEQIGISYYYDFYKDIPESFKIIDMINNLNNQSDECDEKPLRPICHNILNYYKLYVNDLFYNDGISYETQHEFSVGYDAETNCITIPIFSELGDLVGVKGRIFKEHVGLDEMKYWYLEPVPKGRVLYGLQKTLPYIKNAGRVYVFESEKSVMQCWSHGVQNVVATGGCKLSDHQISMLVRLGADIVLCMDKDIEKEKIDLLADRFPDMMPLYYIYDEENILNEKESPSDNFEKWNQLIQNNVYKLR